MAYSTLAFLAEWSASCSHINRIRTARVQFAVWFLHHLLTYRIMHFLAFALLSTTTTADNDDLRCPPAVLCALLSDLLSAASCLFLCWSSLLLCVLAADRGGACIMYNV